MARSVPDNKFSLLVLEMFFVLALIEFPIWFLSNGHFFHFIAYLAGLLFLISFFVWSKNLATLEDLGFRPRLWWPGLSSALWVLGIMFFSLMLGVIFNPRPLDLVRFFKDIGAYYIWALIQQALLLGYFAWRFEFLRMKTKTRVICVGLLFAVLHAPNPLLMVITGVGGAFSAIYFYRFRNLYVLSLAHSIIGAAVLYLPDTWTHHLNIGPRFFR